jgi:WD40 repeat protein
MTKRRTLPAALLAGLACLALAAGGCGENKSDAKKEKEPTPAPVVKEGKKDHKPDPVPQNGTRPDKDPRQPTQPPVAEDDTPPGPVISLAGHTHAVYDIAFAPDGKYALSSGYDKVRVWDLEKRRQKGEWAQELTLLVFTSDGKRVAVGGSSGILSFKDPFTGKPLGASELKHERSIYSFGLSRSGRFAFTVDALGFLRVWDLQTGNLYRKFEHGPSASAAALSPDDHSLLTSGDDKHLRLWNLEKDRQERLFEGHSGRAWPLAFSPDGQRAYSVVFGYENMLRQWDLKSGKELSKLKLSDNPDLYCLAFSDDVRRALVGHLDGSVTLWDLDTQKKMVTYGKHTARVSAVAFSPDGRYALSGDNNGVVWLYRLPGPGTGSTPRREP